MNIIFCKRSKRWTLRYYVQKLDQILTQDYTITLNCELIIKDPQNIKVFHKNLSQDQEYKYWGISSKDQIIQYKGKIRLIK